MSKMGNHVIRQADAAALDYAAENERLWARVRYLEAIISRATMLLDEGDPPAVLLAVVPYVVSGPDEPIDNLLAVAATLARVRALLKA